MQVRRNGQWLSAAMGDEWAMMSVETGNYVTLSRVGARIWELIEQPVSVAAICVSLTGEYEVADEVCRIEVDGFLSDLQAANAIIMEPAAP